MSSFIRHFRLHRTTKDSIVYCALPDEHEGAITVLIGSNNAGKTYTLESLRHALDTTHVNKAERIINLEFTGSAKPSFVYLGNNSQHMGKVGQGIDPFVRPERIGHPRDIPNYRPPAQALLFDMMEEHMPGLRARWEQSHADERRRLLDPFTAVNPLFLCKQDHRVINALQELLGGTLYFRRANAGNQILFEFLLTYEDAGPVPFGQWSDGQKMIFLASMLLQHRTTDVVLVDEIENHLHPERITNFLQLLKSARVQGIITTHHPHVLFSEHASRVYFVEQICKPLNDPPKEMRRDKPSDTVIPIRRFTELRDDFERIEHLYRLFDHHDQELLRLSTRLQAEVDLGLYQELSRAFTHDAVRASAQARPDLQTSQLAKALTAIRHTTERPAIILDLGSGLGRVAKELHKLPHYQHVMWEAWEPNPKTREALREELAITSIRHHVIDDLNEIPDRSVNVALITNVLHELTPPSMGALLEIAARKILPDNGRVVILELYPLLAVEYYAVPYQCADLTDILSASGFTYDEQTYPLRGKLTTAACIIATPVRSINRDEVTTRVREHWRTMKRRSLGSWANKRGVRTFAEYKDVLQHMTTIASISAHDEGLWNT
ncbi:MAG: AAA family ATPase [Acidobacteria bacterium]|nr:AAA family ATPase [Acidobacteriota bacterium]